MIDRVRSFSKSLYSLLRIPSLIVVVLAYLAIAKIVERPGDALRDICMLLALYGGMYSFNDFIDVEADSINNPQRPIPAARLSRVAGLFIAVFLYSCGLMLALTSAWTKAVFATVFIFTSAMYSICIKSVPIVKNVAAALLVSSVVGYATEVAHGQPAGWVVFGASLLLNIGREILMDLRDRDGDASVGIVTLATLSRPATTIAIAGIFTLFGLGVVVGSSFAHTNWAFPAPPAFSVFVTLLWLTGVFFISRTSASSARPIRRVISFYKLYFAFMLLSVIAVGTISTLSGKP